MPLPTWLPGNQLGKPMQNVGYKWVDNGVGGVNYYDGLGKPITREQFGAQAGQDVGSIENWVRDQYNRRGASDTGQVWGDSTATASPASDYSPEDISFLNDQEAQLRNLLGRTDTILNQGLTRNNDEYNREYGRSQADKERQYANFADQRVDQNRNKLSTYDTINRNAGGAFRSLAQIIGRAAGTGSSAFRELLPDVVGKDVSSKRMDANETYGRNLQNIDKSQGQFDISFADVLEDLARQKRSNEESLRSGVEERRQTLNNQLSQTAGMRAQAQGGGYQQVKAAQAPFQAAIDQSRNAVEGFFNTFRTPFAPKQAVATAPELSQYTVDRSAVNASQGQGGDPTNPYSMLLRKRLQGLA